MPRLKLLTAISARATDGRPASLHTPSVALTLPRAAPASGEPQLCPPSTPCSMNSVRRQLNEHLQSMNTAHARPPASLV
eukprot:420439-Prymnesium_polylepis.1